LNATVARERVFVLTAKVLTAKMKNELVSDRKFFEPASVTLPGECPTGRGRGGGMTNPDDRGQPSLPLIPSPSGKFLPPEDATGGCARNAKFPAPKSNSKNAVVTL